LSTGDLAAAATGHRAAAAVGQRTGGITGLAGAAAEAGASNFGSAVKGLGASTSDKTNQQRGSDRQRKCYSTAAHQCM
jgi:hypothetical protein